MPGRVILATGTCIRGEVISYHEKVVRFSEKIFSLPLNSKNKNDKNYSIFSYSFCIRIQVFIVGFLNPNFYRIEICHEIFVQKQGVKLKNWGSNLDLKKKIGNWGPKLKNGVPITICKFCLT